MTFFLFSFRQTPQTYVCNRVVRHYKFKENPNNFLAYRKPPIVLFYDRRLFCIMSIFAGAFHDATDGVRSMMAYLLAALDLMADGAGA